MTALRQDSCAIALAVKDSGRSTTASCDIDGETGTSIDDYNLWCRKCSLFVSDSYGA